MNLHPPVLVDHHVIQQVFIEDFAVRLTVYEGGYFFLYVFSQVIRLVGNSCLRAYRL